MKTTKRMLAYLWTYKTRLGVLNFLSSERFPLKHMDGIAAYCDHHVRFGVVESINTTITVVLRRARGHARRGDAARSSQTVGYGVMPWSARNSKSSG